MQSVRQKKTKKMSRQCADCADNPHLIQQLRAALAWGELLQVVFTLESSVRHLSRYVILNPETLMKKSDLDEL